MFPYCPAQSFSSELDKWKKEKKPLRMVLSVELQSYIPHAPLLLVLRKVLIKAPNSSFRRAF